MTDFPFAPADSWGRRLSVHIGHLFADLPFAERPAAAARCGFVGIEHPEPYALPARQMAALLEDNGLVYLQCGIFGDSAKGERGLAALPGRADDLHRHLAQGLDYAAAIGCRFVHVLSGNTPQDTSPERLWAIYLESLHRAAEQAAPYGVTIIVEAMSMPGYFMHSPQLAAEAIEAVGRDNVRMMFDIFHTANVGLDPIEMIRRCASAIVHLHVADYPGRHEPGTGSVDFGAVTKVLTEIGYGGFIGCEYNPEAGTEAGLRWIEAVHD